MKPPRPGDAADALNREKLIAGNAARQGRAVAGAPVLAAEAKIVAEGTVVCILEDAKQFVLAGDSGSGMLLRPELCGVDLAWVRRNLGRRIRLRASVEIVKDKA